MNIHSTNNIARKKNGPGICHMVFGQELKTVLPIFMYSLIPQHFDLTLFISS